MEAALSQEKIWFDKYKYEEAERIYFEHLAKLLPSDGNLKKKTLNNPKQHNVTSSPTPAPAPNRPIPAPTSVPAPVSVPAPAPAPVPAPTSVSTPVSVPTLTPVAVPEPISQVIPMEPRNEDKRFKAKNRNKAKKDGEKKVEKTPKVESKVDGIAKLTTDGASVEVNNRLNSLESENVTLKKDIKDLRDIVKKLTDRITALEKSGSSAKAAPATAKPSTAKPSAPAKQDDDDDGVDLFASESEEEDEESKKVKEQRLAEYAAKKSKKPVLIAKSNIILDVKPWDDETDMKKLEQEVRKIETDGLIWGASKLVPLAYGIHKLQISCVVEDDKVSIDWLQEQIETNEDYVQSVDIAAFNKV